jgi:hypothetical protein
MKRTSITLRSLREPLLYQTRSADRRDLPRHSL